ncbi:MAG: glycosyltransferase family 4 protein [Candidatus Aenigmatarchaeota archaeon]
MKILVFNWRDIKNPEAGGAERYTHEIFKRIAKGNEVTLFTSEFPGCKKEESLEGIRIVRKGGKYSLYLKAKEYYKKYFSKEGFDVVIDEINTIPFFAPKFVRGEKVICLIHQLAREFWFYETSFPISWIGYYWLENKWLKNYIDIPTITVSESTKMDLLSLGFKKVFIVHNGANVKPLKKPPKKAEKPTIIFVGRMKRAKKPQDVLEAFKIVRRRMSDVRLWMVGDGYLRRKLEKISTGEVRFFGYLDEKKKIELMKKAWVIVVPGVREGWGQVVTDANALATPAIAYDVPGLRDSLKDNYNGMLVENNPKALAQTIIKVLEDEKLRSKLSKNALEWARKFDWDRSAKEFEKIIKMVIKKK